MYPIVAHESLAQCCGKSLCRPRPQDGQRLAATVEQQIDSAHVRQKIAPYLRIRWVCVFLKYDLSSPGADSVCIKNRRRHRAVVQDGCTHLSAETDDTIGLIQVGIIS